MFFHEVNISPKSLDAHKHMETSSGGKTPLPKPLQTVIYCQGEQNTDNDNKQ